MPTSPGFRIGRILGIPIYLHGTWIFIFVLITTLLAAQFAQEHPQWSQTQHWAAALATSLLFFASVLFHELAHSMIARIYKIRVASITLFFFGGVARITREPAKPIQEFNIAVAGPLSSFFLAAVFLGLTQFFPKTDMLGALSLWLCRTNAALAGFNLLPGFPLDGGRIFRAAVWGITKDFSRATRLAGAAGKLVAYGMIVYGVAHAIRGELGFLWYCLIGYFLLTAAQEMRDEVPTMPRDISLGEYGQEVARTGRRCHLITTGDRLVGMMNVHTLNSVRREDWPNMSVQAVMIPREKILWAAPEEPLLSLLERLLNADVNQMPVVSGSDGDGAHIIGMVTRDSILRVMQARSEVGSLAAAK